MIYLLYFIISYLLGRGVLRVLYGKELRENRTGDCILADSVLTGGMVFIGLAEAAHLGAVILGRSFSDSVKIFLAGLVILLVLAAVLILAGRHLEKPVRTSDKVAEGDRMIWFVFGVMVLIQLLLLVTTKEIHIEGDMTPETVNSMLVTDGIYQVNPMTGQPYAQGVPMRLKILCLPTLYGILCKVFHMSAAQVVWGVVPVLTLLGSYLAFYTVARTLFPNERKKRALFMVFIALLLWAGSEMMSTDGFGLQYAGYRGVTIRACVILPYLFGLLLRKKWKLVPLCILAEACIVWTLYGMGVGLLMTGIMVLMIPAQKKFCKKKDTKNIYQNANSDLQGGEEDSL